MRLIADRLSALRGEDLIFSNISFNLSSGQSLILTGRNGSGKSTLLRVVAGLIRQHSGTVTWQATTGDAGTAVAENCHYLGHRNAMKSEMTVAENLTFWKSFLDIANSRQGLSADEAAEQVQLGGITHLPFGYLSAGQQRRMAFAKLLISWRPIWILDEPTAALDSSAEALFASLINAHLAVGGIVLAATHQRLDFEATQRLEMRGFQYAEMEEGL